MQKVARVGGGWGGVPAAGPRTGKRLPMATISSLFIKSSVSKCHRFTGILFFNVKTHTQGEF